MFLGTRSFTTSHGGEGGGYKFLKMHRMWGGSYRTVLLCKSCQTVLWLKQIHVSFKRRTKKYTLAVLCKQLNITRVSSAQDSISYFSYQECNMHVRTAPMHTAEIWKKILTFLSLNRDKYFALYWCFCVRISFIFFLIKWSEMDSNVKMWSHRP